MIPGLAQWVKGSSATAHAAPTAVVNDNKTLARDVLEAFLKKLKKKKKG